MNLATAADAARIYRVPIRTLRRWVYEGRLVDHSPWADRTRSRVVVDLAELEQLLDTLDRMPTR